MYRSRIWIQRKRKNEGRIKEMEKKEKEGKSQRLKRSNRKQYAALQLNRRNQPRLLCLGAICNCSFSFSIFFSLSLSILLYLIFVSSRELFSIFSVFIHAFFHGSLFINLCLDKFYLFSSSGVFCLSSLPSLAPSLAFVPLVHFVITGLPFKVQ
mgnify:CR=1 FL=1